MRLANRGTEEWLEFAKRLLHVQQQQQTSGVGCTGPVEIGDLSVWLTLLDQADFDARLSSTVCSLLTQLAQRLMGRSRRAVLEAALSHAAGSQTVLGRLLTPLLAAEASISEASTASMRRVLVDFVRTLLAQDAGCLTRLLPLLRDAPAAAAPSNGLLLDLLTAVAEQRPGGRRTASIAPSGQEVGVAELFIYFFYLCIDTNIRGQGCTLFCDIIFKLNFNEN